MTVPRLAWLLPCIALAGCEHPRVEPNIPPVPLNARPGRVIPPAKGYHLSGDTALWPTAISDDGSKTYISWDITQPLPAVFALADNGEEELVDSYMRNDILVVDRIYDNLMFRIDKAAALAHRLPSIRSAP